MCPAHDDESNTESRKRNFPQPRSLDTVKYAHILSLGDHLGNIILIHFFNLINSFQFRCSCVSANRSRTVGSIPKYWIIHLWLNERISNITKWIYRRLKRIYAKEERSEKKLNALALALCIVGSGECPRSRSTQTSRRIFPLPGSDDRTKLDRRRFFQHSRVHAYSIRSLITTPASCYTPMKSWITAPDPPVTLHFTRRKTLSSLFLDKILENFCLLLVTPNCYYFIIRLNLGGTWWSRIDLEPAS